jgi:hypothetical protein
MMPQRTEAGIPKKIGAGQNKPPNSSLILFISTPKTLPLLPVKKKRINNIF